jgi:hypothetical protein
MLTGAAGAVVPTAVRAICSNRSLSRTCLMISRTWAISLSRRFSIAMVSVMKNSYYTAGCAVEIGYPLSASAGRGASFRFAALDTAEPAPLKSLLVHQPSWPRCSSQLAGSGRSSRSSTSA